MLQSPHHDCAPLITRQMHQEKIYRTRNPNRTQKKITSFPEPSLPDNRRETRDTPRAATDLTRRLRRPQSPGTLIAAREKNAPPPRRRDAGAARKGAQRARTPQQRTGDSVQTSAPEAPPRHPHAPRALTNNWTFRLVFSIDGVSEPHCPDVREKG